MNKRNYNGAFEFHESSNKEFRYVKKKRNRRNRETFISRLSMSTGNYITPCYVED